MSIPRARPSWYTFGTRTDLQSADAGSASSPSTRRARPDHTPPDADLPALESDHTDADRGARFSSGRGAQHARTQARSNVPAGSSRHGLAGPGAVPGMG